MANATELRKYSVKLVCGECDGHGSRQKFEAEDNKLGICVDCWGNGALNDKVHEFYKSEMQDQIEQAERARTEEIIEWLELESSSGDIAPNAHQQDCARFARILRSKFLTKPNHE